MANHFPGLSQDLDNLNRQKQEDQPLPGLHQPEGLPPQKPFKLGEFVLDNIVTIIFVAFVLLGFLVAQQVSFHWFLTELSHRFYRNAFLVLSLIIPVIAGLGLNFGIVVGAISGQLAVALVRYYYLGGLGGLALCFLIALPIAVLFGWLTGLLYNKTRGQEMIASLIVGFFANGVYQFIMLFLVGAVIPVAEGHPMIMPNGVGIRMTVDMDTLKYALENIYLAPFDITLQVSFEWMLVVMGGLALLYVLWSRFLRKYKPGKSRPSWFRFAAYLLGSLAVLILGLNTVLGNGLMDQVRDVPIATLLLILLLVLFTKWIMTTKLGQDFRSCGQNQYIAESNGINVNRIRIIATILSTVLAAWGQIIYLQNIGTLNTYGAHNQIGFFSVAAILVGGASVSKATVSQALIGTLLFNAMFIMSPEIGKAVFGQAILGEYFRTFMVYGVIGLALGLYVWKANKQNRVVLEPEDVMDQPVKDVIGK